MLFKAIQQLCKEPAALGPQLVGTASANGSSTLLLTGITDLQQGDLVIFWGTDDTRTGVRTINSSGWTVEIDGNNNSIQNIIAYKVMGSTVDTSVSVDTVADALTATAWRGVTWDARSGYTTASSNTINPVSSTVTTDNSVVIVLGAIDDDNSTISSPPTGYTVAVQDGRLGGSNAQMYKTGVSAGTENPSSYTWSSTDALLSRTVILAPTASGFAPCLSFGGGSSSQISRSFFTSTVDLTYLNFDTNTSDTIGNGTRSYTISVPLVSSSDYVIIVTGNQSSTGDNNSITGCTVNSTTATSANVAQGSNTRYSEGIFYVTGVSGTSLSVSVSYTGTDVFRSLCFAYVLKNVSGLSVVDTDSLNGAGNLVVNVPNGSFVIATAGQDSGTPTLSGTGITSDDTQTVESFWIQTVASGESTGTGTTIAVSNSSLSIAAVFTPA